MATRYKTNCFSETDLIKVQKDVEYLVQRVDSLHAKVVGNGKPGLVDEMNQLKGSINVVKWGYGAIIALITVALGIFKFGF